MQVPFKSRLQLRVDQPGIFSVRTSGEMGHSATVLRGHVAASWSSQKQTEKLTGKRGCQQGKG